MNPDPKMVTAAAEYLRLGRAAFGMSAFGMSIAYVKYVHAIFCAVNDKTDAPNCVDAERNALNFVRCTGSWEFSERNLFVNCVLASAVKMISSSGIEGTHELDEARIQCPILENNPNAATIESLCRILRMVFPRAFVGQTRTCDQMLSVSDVAYPLIWATNVYHSVVSTTTTPTTPAYVATTKIFSRDHVPTFLNAVYQSSEWRVIAPTALALTDSRIRQVPNDEWIRDTAVFVQKVDKSYGAIFLLSASDTLDNDLTVKRSVTSQEDYEYCRVCVLAYDSTTVPHYLAALDNVYPSVVGSCKNVPGFFHYRLNAYIPDFEVNKSDKCDTSALLNRVFSQFVTSEIDANSVAWMSAPSDGLETALFRKADIVVMIYRPVMSELLLSDRLWLSFTSPRDLITIYALPRNTPETTLAGWVSNPSHNWVLAFRTREGCSHTAVFRPGRELAAFLSKGYANSDARLVPSLDLNALPHKLLLIRHYAGSNVLLMDAAVDNETKPFSLICSHPIYKCFLTAFDTPTMWNLLKSRNPPAARDEESSMVRLASGQYVSYVSSVGKGASEPLMTMPWNAELLENVPDVKILERKIINREVKLGVYRVKFLEIPSLDFYVLVGQWGDTPFDVLVKSYARLTEMVPPSVSQTISFSFIKPHLSW